MFPALKSHVSLLMDQGGAHLDTSHVTLHEMRSAPAKRLARLKLPLSRIQFYVPWSGVSLWAFVEEAVEESEDVRGLEHVGRAEGSTYGCCGFLPLTSSARVTFLDLDKMS